MRNRVFVVHGRNQRARKAFFAFLRSLDLRPIEWEQALRRTGPSPPIDQVISERIPEADAILILLTGDDEVRLRPELASPENQEEFEVSLQARPNVIFEAGVALGVRRERTVFVSLGEVKRFSDIAGLFVARITRDPESLKKIVELLKATGCKVNDSGSDWMDTAPFTSALEFPRTQESVERDYHEYLKKWKRRVHAKAGSGLASERVGQVMEDRQACIVRQRNDDAFEIIGLIEKRMQLTNEKLPFAAIVESRETYRLLGVITPSDLPAKFAIYSAGDSVKANAIWTEDPFTLNPFMTWEEAEAYRTEKGVLSGLPVVDDRHQFIGWLPPRGLRDFVGP